MDLFKKLVKKDNTFLSGRSFSRFMLITAVAVITCLPAALLAVSSCAPTSAVLCAAVDDAADIYINGTLIQNFIYCDISWACTPVCVNLTAGEMNSLNDSGNLIAVYDQNTNCCEMWASWSLDINCSNGTQVIVSSDNNPVKMYADDTCETVPTPNPSPTPIGGLQWYNPLYNDTSGWTAPMNETGYKYGKRLFDPSTGDLLQALSDHASMSTGCGALWFREGFNMTPVPTPMPPSFTITKNPNPYTGIKGPGSITFTLHICNTGGGTLGDPVKIVDTWYPPGGDGWRFDQFLYGGALANWDYTDPAFGEIKADVNGPPTTITLVNGFNHNSCLDIAYRLTADNPVSQCTTWHNDVALSVPAYTPAVATAYATAVLQNFCPSPTSTWTNSPTKTITPTMTATPTFTYTVTPTITPMPPVLSMVKSANPVSGITNGTAVSFNMHFCNTGGIMNSGQMTLIDDYTSSLDNWQYDGPFYIGGPAVGINNISASNGSKITTYTITFQSPGFTGCVDIPMNMHMTSLPVDCAWYNKATLQSWTPLPTIVSTVNMANVCSPTFTPTFTMTSTQLPGTMTFTPTFTFTRTMTPTYTYTITFTSTYTSTRTPTPTATPTSTQVPLQIQLTKTVTKNIYMLGDTITYCLQFTNNGATAASFTVWDTVPAVTTFVGCSGGAHTSVCTTQTFGPYVVAVWNVTALPAGQSDSVCFYTQVTSLPYFIVNKEFLALLEDEKYLAFSGGYLSDRSYLTRHDDIPGNF